MSETRSKEQEVLLARAEGGRDAANRARKWVETVRATVPSIANEAESLIEESRRLENLCAKVANATTRRMCVGVYGASQQGKSYLVSILARPPGKAQLLAKFADEKLDFITEINPSGGKESTGLVTRFSIHPSGHEVETDFPVELRLLTETDLVKILANAFQSDFDQNNLEIEAPDDDAVCAVLAACEAKASAKPVATHLDEIGLFDLGEYFSRNFKNRWEELNPIRYWERVITLAPRLDAATRADLFSVLWGGIAELTDLFRTLVGWLEILGHAETAATELAALRPRARSIIDVAALKRLGSGADDADRLRVKTIRGADHGGPHDLPRAVLASLVAELRITIDERPWEMLDHADVLDFPGARSRYKLTDLPAPGTNAEGTNPRQDLILELLLRGKIAYLFQRYAEERELTSLLLCMGNKPNEVKDLGFLVRNWIELTQGSTPKQRSNTSTALFVVLTMIDLEFQAKAGESLEQKWDIRLHTSLTEPYKHDHWVDDWDGKPFRNTVMLRNPNFDQEWLVEYETAATGELVKPLREIGLSTRNAGHRAALEASFKASQSVARHIQDPAQAWEAMLKLNDGGVAHIVERLGAMLRPSLKYGQLRQRLEGATQALIHNLSRYYHGVDEQTLREKEEALKSLRAALNTAFRKQHYRAFPRFITNLMLSEREIRDVVRSVGAMSITPLADSAVAEEEEDIFGAAPTASASSTPAVANDRARLFVQELHRRWIAQLRRLTTDEAQLKFYGLHSRDAAMLVDQLIVMADRLKAEEKLASRVRASTQLAAGLWDDMADRMVTLAQHSFNGLVAELGYSEVPVADRPGVPEGVQPPTSYVFQMPATISRPAGEGQVRQLPTLGDQPEPTERRYFIHWGIAFLATALANLSYGGGRELNEQQNRTLGDILRQIVGDTPEEAESA